VWRGCIIQIILRWLALRDWRAMCKHKDLELSFATVNGVSVPCGFVCACGYEYDLYELAEKHKAHIEKDEKRSAGARKVAEYARFKDSEASIYLGWVYDSDAELVLAYQEIERLKVENEKLRS